MLPTTLLEHIVNHCRLVLPPGTTILQPGDTTSGPNSSAWAEFWIDRITSPVARRTAPVNSEFSLTVHCFGRPPQPVESVTQLALSLHERIRGAIIPIDSDNALLGSLRIREPECRDLSRPATAKSTGLWHWILTAQGTTSLTS